MCIHTYICLQQLVRKEGMNLKEGKGGVHGRVGRREANREVM